MKWLSRSVLDVHPSGYTLSSAACDAFFTKSTLQRCTQHSGGAITSGYAPTANYLIMINSRPRQKITFEWVNNALHARHTLRKGNFLLSTAAAREGDWGRWLRKSHRFDVFAFVTTNICRHRFLPIFRSCSTQQGPYTRVYVHLYPLLFTLWLPNHTVLRHISPRLLAIYAHTYTAYSSLVLTRRSFLRFDWLLQFATTTTYRTTLCLHLRLKM